MSSSNPALSIRAITFCLAWLAIQGATAMDAVAQTAASDKPLMDPNNGGVGGTGMGTVPKSSDPSKPPHAAGSGMSVGGAEQGATGKGTGPLNVQDSSTATDIKTLRGKPAGP